MANAGLIIEIVTILSIVVMVIPVLAAMGLFKSRRQREVEAKLNHAMKYGARSAAAAFPPDSRRQELVGAAGAAPQTAGRAQARLKSFEGGVVYHGHVQTNSTPRMQRRFRRSAPAPHRHSADKQQSQSANCPHCGLPI